MTEPLAVPVADLAAIASRIVCAALRNVARTGTDADLKACIMTAREHGHIDDEHTEFLIAAWGLAGA